MDIDGSNQLNIGDLGASGNPQVEGDIGTRRIGRGRRRCCHGRHRRHIRRILHQINGQHRPPVPYFCKYRFCKTSIQDSDPSDPQMNKFYAVISEKVGPKTVKILKMLVKIKLLKPILKLVAGVGTNLLKNNGQLEQLLAGGNIRKALQGPTLKRREQKQLYAALTQITAECIACEVTLIVTLLANGLLGKVLKLLGPLLAKLIPAVAKLVKKLKLSKLTSPLIRALLGPDARGHGGGGLLSGLGGVLGGVGDLLGGAGADAGAGVGVNPGINAGLHAGVHLR